MILSLSTSEATKTEWLNFAVTHLVEPYAFDANSMATLQKLTDSVELYPERIESLAKYWQQATKMEIHFEHSSIQLIKLASLNPDIVQQVMENQFSRCDTTPKLLRLWAATPPMLRSNMPWEAHIARYPMYVKDVKKKTGYVPHSALNDWLNSESTWSPEAFKKGCVAFVMAAFKQTHQPTNHTQRIHKGLTLWATHLQDIIAAHEIMQLLLNRIDAKAFSMIQWNTLFNDFEFMRETWFHTIIESATERSDWGQCLAGIVHYNEDEMAELRPLLMSLPAPKTVSDETFTKMLAICNQNPAYIDMLLHRIGGEEALAKRLLLMHQRVNDILKPQPEKATPQFSLEKLLQRLTTQTWHNLYQGIRSHEGHLTSIPWQWATQYDLPALKRCGLAKRKVLERMESQLKSFKWNPWHESGTGLDLYTTLTASLSDIKKEENLSRFFKSKEPHFLLIDAFQAIEFELTAKHADVVAVSNTMETSLLNVLYTLANTQHTPVYNVEELCLNPS